MLFILFISAYSGYKSGLLNGMVRVIGYTLSFIVAINNYKTVSNYIYMIIPYPSPYSPTENPFFYYDKKMIFSLDQSYYYLVAILLILLIGWVITRFISQLLSYFTVKIRLPKRVDGVGGSIIGFFTTYLTMFLLLLTLSTIPYEQVQSKISESWLADRMLTSTPKLSEESYRVFIQKVHEEEVDQQPVMDIDAINKQEENEE